METVLFKVTLSLYTLAMVFSFVYLASKKERWADASGILLGLGVFSHLASFVFRTTAFWKFPENQFYFPINTFFGALSYLGLSIMVILLIIERSYKLRVLSAFVLPFGWLACAGAWFFADPKVAGLVPALQSYWINIHPMILMATYAVLTNSFGVGAALLIQERQLKSKHPSSLIYRLPSVEDMDQISYRLISVAFPFLTLGVILGGVWAHGAWGRFWGWDAKETWALITWFFYVIYLHLRLFNGMRGRKLVYVSFLGFASVIFTFIGVNFLSGLHGYLSGG